MAEYSTHFNKVEEFAEKAKSALVFLGNTQFIGEGNGFLPIVQQFAPELIDRDYCDDLGREFTKEVRENLLRFAECNRLDRYGNELFRLLRFSLDRIFRTIKLYDTVKRDKDGVFVDEDGNCLQEKLFENARSVDDALRNLNQIRHPLHNLLKPNFPQQWAEYDSILKNNGIPQPAEPGVKKSKKEQQTGLKEQLIILDELGLLDAGKLGRLNPKQKAKLFALLLNRTGKDTYELLRNWQSRKDPNVMDSKYLIKDHHEETVKDWLLDSGVHS